MQISRKERFALQKWLESLLYDPKHMKQKDDNFIKLLAPAFIGVLLCLACLVGMTWAWFGVSVQSGSNHISAANYDLKVTVVKGDANTATVTKNDGVYYVTLEKNVTYQITLKGGGNATIGFGTLTAAESDGAGNAVVYYTKPIATPSATSSENPNTRSFSVKSGQPAQLVIKPVWGEFSPEIFSDENTTYRLVDNQQIYLWGAMAETTLIENGDSDSGSQQQTSASSQVAATSSVASQTTETTSAVSSSEPEQNATESVPSSQITITSEPTVSQEQVTE